MNVINQKSHHFQNHETKRVTLLGLLINLILTSTKLIVGILGNSQAVIADGFHSLSDMITDLSILLGVNFWLAPPDENHPYGHRRIEALFTISISIILFFVALLLIYNSITNIQDGNNEIPKKIALLGSVLTIILKEFVYQITIKTGKKIRSSALIANAWHHRSDALSSIPVIIAVIVAIYFPNLAFVDNIGAVIVSIFIFKVSFNILKPALNELSDHGADQQACDSIKHIASSVEGVKDAHAIRTRKVGNGYHVDMHILVDPNLTVKDGHDISENVTNILLNKGPNIIDVIIHIEPY